MSMDERQLRLDGNAVAGLLDEVFVSDVTMVRGPCAGCGQVAMIGAQHLYMYRDAPGAVLRCKSCDNVLMVVVHTGGRMRLSMRGWTWLEMGSLVAPG
jgi:hypothetical protein